MKRGAKGSAATAWIATALADLEVRGRRRVTNRIRPVSPVEAERDGKRVVLFSSNDYLGLSSHPRVLAAVRRALEGGVGAARSSALLSGWTDAHASLEAALALWKGTDAALLFPSGYQAGCGVIPALVGDGDEVFSDEWNHASLVDGCRLSRARRTIFRHLDAMGLDAKLGASRARRKLIVTESLFSMDGDRAPLRRYVASGERHGAMLLVDEAHANLVFGPDGAGFASEDGLSGRVDVHLGTLSKAFGAHGGFVACSQSIRDLLVSTCRTVLFSTALPPVLAAAAEEALAVTHDEPRLRDTLLANAAALHELLAGLPGLRGGDAPSPILPVVVGDSGAAVRLSEALLDLGFYVPAVRPPTVPSGTARLRISVSALHDSAHLAGLADGLRRLLLPEAAPPRPI